MDIQAIKAVSSVAASPVSKGTPGNLRADAGKDLPPPPSGRIDPEFLQSQQERHAALARQMSAYLHSNSRDLVFQVDPESGQPIVSVLDASGNVVRTIPGEEALQMLRRVNVELGTFIDSVA